MTQFFIFLVGFKFVLNLVYSKYFHFALGKPDRHPLILWVLSCILYHINLHTYLLFPAKVSVGTEKKRRFTPLFRLLDMIDFNLMFSIFVSASSKMR